MSTTYRIPKGGHYSWPFFALPWVGNPSIKRRIKLDSSCKYVLSGTSVDNVNKLLGLTFGVLPRKVNGEWVGPGHYNSARFGFVWSVKYDCWKILDYCYREGKKNWDDQLRYREICRVQDGMTIDAELTYVPRSGDILFMVSQVLNPGDKHEQTIPMPSLIINELPANLSPFGLRMGFFFGGKDPAPHPMKAEFSHYE